MAIFRSIPPSAASEMAWLASLAYDEDVSLSTLFGTSGWRPLGADDLGLPDRFFDTEGFYENRSADGYAAVHGQTFALVFRGSDNFGDLLSSAFAQDSYYDNLRPLIDASFGYIADNDIAAVEMTGHSLGAAMAMRTAAVNDLGDVADGVSWRLMTFASPGTDVDDTSADSRSIVNVSHSGDAVSTDPLLDRLTEHGSRAFVELPNVENADNLAELDRQKDEPGRITEHDVGRYLLSVQAVAASPLYAWSDDKTVAVVLDAPDGSARNDAYRVSGDNRLVLGLGGADALSGNGGRDLLDGGAGSDVLQAFAGDDVLSGGGGGDRLDGGSGHDRLDYDALAHSRPDAAGRDLVLGFAGIGDAEGDRFDLSGIDANGGLAGNQAFAFIGSAPFRAPGQVRVVANGSDSLIEAEVTGDAGADFAILVRDGAALPAQWAEEDFIL